MKLKESVNYIDFLRCVHNCAGEVHFRTEQGDYLNLKSFLSEFIFIHAATDSDLVRNGIVECELAADYTLIQEYLQTD